MLLLSTAQDTKNKKKKRLEGTPSQIHSEVSMRDQEATDKLQQNF